MEEDLPEMSGLYHPYVWLRRFGMVLLNAPPKMVYRSTYKTVYYLFTADTQQAISSLITTIGAAGAIAIAIFIVDAVVAVIKKIGIRGDRN